MPPKDKKKPGEEEEPVEEEKDLLEKELVISYLKSKLASYQEQSDALRVDNYKLSEELEDQKSRLKDINEFLVNELKARALSFAALQSELSETKQTMEENQTHFQSELKRITEESEKIIADLEERMADSDRKARSAEEYLGMREELLKEKANLHEKMQEMRTQFELQISEVERQHVQDRDKWKKTMAKRIQETKQYMIQLTDNQLELTTKRTIMENEQMSAEMAYQSHQTSSVLAQNLQLDKRMAQLKRELSLSRDTQDELSKRNLVYQRAIKHLLVWMRENDGKKMEQDTDAATSDKLLTELQQELRRQELLAENHDADLAELKSKLAQKDAEAAEKARSVKDTSSFLLACMEDVKTKVIEVDANTDEKNGDNSMKLLPGQLKDLSQSQRERVLAFLLEKLLILEGSDSELLGIVRPTSSAFELPDIKAAPLTKQLNGVDVPAVNPVTAALDPEGAHDSLKLPITPPPKMIASYWGNTTGQVLHEVDGAGAACSAFPPCMLSASTQTCDPQMESADRLLNKVMRDVRPWGHRAKSHPAVVKPPTVKKGPQPQRPMNTSRGSVATPTGPLPHQGGDNFPKHSILDLDPDIASAVNCQSIASQKLNNVTAADIPPPIPGVARSSSRGTAVSRVGVASRGSRGATSSRGTAGNLLSNMGSMVDVGGDKLSEVQEGGKSSLLSHFKPG